MSTRSLLAATVATSFALAGPAMAQTVNLTTPAATQAADPADPAAPVGKQAGTFMVRLRAIGVIPLVSSSRTTIGGHLDVSASAAPEVDVSYFFTDHIAAELIAATTRHMVKAKGTVLGDVDIGTTWVLPPTVTLQYHFMPHERFSPYLGAGLNATWFYATNPSGPTVTSFSIAPAVGFALQAGFDYNISGHWFLNADIKQIFMRNTARVNGGAIRATAWLNPMVIGAGVGYRF